MENKYRNEMEIKLGEKIILLRPTFENLQEMECNIGSLTYLAWKFEKGTTIEEKIKALPSLTEIAQIIFFNQAARLPNDPTKRMYSLEEIFQDVMADGSTLIVPITKYLSKLMAGNRLLDEKKEGEQEKKS